MYVQIPGSFTCLSIIRYKHSVGYKFVSFDRACKEICGYSIEKPCGPCQESILQKHHHVNT